MRASAIDFGARLLIASGLIATSDDLIEALVAGAVTVLLVLDWLLVRSLQATVKSAIATAERAVELTQNIVVRTMRTVS